VTGAARKDHLAPGVPLMMDNRPRSTVAVRPAKALSDHARLFTALELAFAVRFVASDEADTVADGLLRVGDVAPAPSPVPSLAFAGESAAAPVQDVRLLDDPAVDPRLRGLVLPQHRLAAPLEVREGDAILAAVPSGPAWLRRRDGGASCDVVRVPLTELAPDEGLRRWLLEDRALALVALVQFLRSLTSDGSAAPPALRAAFVFDDPNLRRPGYGYIGYRDLVAHADLHGYHAAMAMIPLDARWPHPAAVELFRRRPDRLSLVVHGNNHERRELMQERDREQSLALGAQALRRIGRFEAESGLSVDRILIPPHGMCSPGVAQALGALGFDALCAIHPRPWTERPPGDLLLAGWAPGDFAEGCAVIPRFPLTCSAAEIGLRAFLDQPLVLYGHHEDVADGLESLADAAARVNRVGDVTWCSLGDVAAGNYGSQLDGERLTLQPFTRRARLEVPAGVSELSVLAPAEDGEPQLAGWSVEGRERVAFGATVPVEPGSAVVVHVHGTTEVSPMAPQSPPWRPWPVLRRAATEIRDRLAPLT